MQTMATILERAARLYGERLAIIDGPWCKNWSEYLERITRAAGVLVALGIRTGDRFGIISHNTFRMAELINAGYWLGAVAVPINYRLAPPEIDYILKDADCRLLAVEDVFLHMLATPELIPYKTKSICLAGTGTATDIPCYETLLDKAEPQPMQASRPDDDAILLYTGGTTGRSKGVRLSHANILANALQIGLAISARESDRFLHIMPMFHSADLFGTVFTLVGGVHVYVSAFTPKNLLQAVHEHRLTVLSLGPTILIRTLQVSDFDQYDCSSIRLIFYGSAPMAVEWINRTMLKFPNAGLQQGYGLTETAPILTTLTPEDHHRAIHSGRYELLRSVGKPVVLVDLRIVDEAGIDQPVGAIGEVVVRGPNVSKGYLGLPEQNAATFRDGWFHTGDLGQLDRDNNLYIMDRMKDMIITGSENVYSSEVEAALYKHPAIHEAAVVGVPDEQWGEAVFAVIVPTPGQTLSKDEVIEHCRKFIGGFKIPRRMAFVSELPKSAM
ncbi:MAG: putative 4-coumarate--CoA ligase 2 (4CL 2) (4-coumaroyl-CoA synthase 2), partial [Gammaproteobacteria bacterium]|nr:putative 4-coumarate--CoA ligase 2 (4CL 2) (4-coumaroyl-CoA synthase 2) [Gammaproteobacteria bacterium]